MDIRFRVNFEDGLYAEYSLFNSEVTEQWIRVHNRYRSKGYNYQANIEFYIYHTHGCDLPTIPGQNVTLQDCRDKISYYISEANSCIEGEPFPYTSNGLPAFEISNLLHRAFTVSSITAKSWTHDLSDSDLLEYKKLPHDLRKSFMHDHTKERFTVKNGMFEKFLESVEYINNWVHMAEVFPKSLRGEKANLEAGGSIDYSNTKGKYLELDWDARNDNGVRPEYLGEPLDYGIIQDSMQYFEEADLFVGKNISGKDYEIAFFQYDNPLEFDTVNGDYNEGTIRAHLTDEFKSFYKIGGDFHNWCAEKGITPDLYRPIPLGKLISTNINTEDIKEDTNNRGANGQSLFFSPYRLTSTELVVS